MRVTAIVFTMLLAGCATCAQHPVACSIGGALIVGSVAASIELRHDHRHSQGVPQINHRPCSAGAC